MILSSILAGVFISIGGVVYLSVGGVAGAVLFSFGLLAVVHYKVKLYTGTAGFFNLKNGWCTLALILIGNIIGCWLASMVFGFSNLSLAEKCAAIVAKRLDSGPLAVIALATGCGIIMTTAVKFAKEGKYLPLLFGVPTFILCGFSHSIADAFYFLTDMTWSIQKLWVYLASVLGNFIGCNIPRLLLNIHGKNDPLPF